MRRTEQKEQTRQRLLAAAREVFEAEGFENANVRQIAERAGIAPGTVFVHVKDKHDLLHTALFEDLEATLNAVLNRPDGDSLESWLVGLTDGMFAYYEARPNLSRVLLQESMLAGPPWSDRFGGQWVQTHVAIIGRAQRAQAAGELSPTTDLPLLAAAYLSFYLAGLLAWVKGTHPDPRGFVAQLTEQHLKGLRP